MLLQKTKLTILPILKVLSHKGQLIFGMGCGLLTFIIRRWGGYPEGVSYSILIMNATVPLIDGMFSNRVFGTGKK